MKLSITLTKSTSAKPRVYFWPEGETVLNNMVNRTSRPYKLYREFLPAVLSLASKLSGHAGITDARANWSKHAGCTMCPCSPGFILSEVRDFGFDIHVTLTGPASTGGEEQAHRRGQLGL